MVGRWPVNKTLLDPSYTTSIWGKLCRQNLSHILCSIICKLNLMVFSLPRPVCLWLYLHLFLIVSGPLIARCWTPCMMFTVESRWAIMWSRAALTATASQVSFETAALYFALWSEKIFACKKPSSSINMQNGILAPLVIFLAPLMLIKPLSIKVLLLYSTDLLAHAWHLLFIMTYCLFRCGKFIFYHLPDTDAVKCALLKINALEQHLNRQWGSNIMI